MANWSDLKAAVAQVIKTNGNNEITGQILQDTLNSIISNVGANATYVGIATPTTNPGAPDGNVFYFATQAGTYTNFGSVELNEGLNILRWNGTSWSVTNVMNIAQELGTSETAVLSQKAATDAIELNLIYAITNGYKLNGSDISQADNFWQRGILNDRGEFTPNSSSNYFTSDFISFENTSSQKFSAIEVSLAVDSYSFPNVCYYKKDTKEFVYGFQLIAKRAIIFIPNGYSVRVSRDKNFDPTVIFSANSFILDKAVSNLEDGCVTTDKLAPNSVTTSKLAPNSVTNDKVQSNAITELNTTFTELNIEKNQFIPLDSNSEYTTTIYEYGGGTHTSEGWGSNIIPIGDNWIHINWSSYDTHDNAGAFLNEDKEVILTFNGTTTSELDIPAGAKYIALTVHSTSLTSTPIIVDEWDGFTIPELNLTDKQKEKVLSKTIEVETDITEEIYSENTAYTTVIGQAPTENSEISTQYNIKGKIYSTQGIVKFHLHSQSGNTCRLWAKINNGVITEMANYSATVEDVGIECDGTFDQIVINLYGGTATKTITETINSLDEVENRLDEVENRLDEVENRLDEEKRTLRILMFGNSFTHDSVGYVPYIFKQIAPCVDIKIGIAMYSACSLAQHLANLTGENVIQGDTTYIPDGYGYSISKEDGTWDTTWHVDGNEILSKEDWDIVTFQQNGDNIDKDWDSYFAPYIYKLQKIIYDKVNKSARLGWIIAHSSYSGTNLGTLKTRYENGIVNAKKAFDNTLCQIIFPYGTAIQNLRSVYQSSWGGQANLLANDNVHLQEGLPALTAAYTYVIKILDLIGMSNKSIVGDDTSPIKEWVEKYALGPNYYNDEVMTVNEDNRFISQVCAIQAIKNPYAVSDLSELMENL